MYIDLKNICKKCSTLEVVNTFIPLDDKNIYKEVYLPKHPDSRVNGCIYEHRLIMEKIIGRRLRDYEVVHHLNKVKTDNSVENLYLCKNQREHAMKFHPRIYAKYFDSEIKEEIRRKIKPGTQNEYFDRYLKLYGQQIVNICKDITKNRINNRVEYDDLYQEALICLLKLSQKEEVYNLNYISKSIRNALIDYVRRWAETELINLEELDRDDFNEFKI